MTETKYETSEALLLMADAEERSRSDDKKQSIRRAGAVELFNSLEALDTQHEFRIDILNEGGLIATVKLPSSDAHYVPEVKFEYKMDTFEFLLFKDGVGKGLVTGLGWDHRAQRWQGPVLDEATGARRAALAVLVEAATNA